MEKLLSSQEKEFLREFNLNDLCTGGNYPKCVNSIIENLKYIVEFRTDELSLIPSPFDIFKHSDRKKFPRDTIGDMFYPVPQLHCNKCEERIFNKNIYSIFMAIKIRQFLLKNTNKEIIMYSKASNNLELKNIDRTYATISMVKTNRKNRSIEEKFNFYGWYNTDHYPADVLQLNDEECYNLKSNNEIIELEHFPYNIIRMAKIFYEKGSNPIKRAKSCQSKIKILTAMYAANINYRDTLYFKEDCTRAYEELIPLQIKYFFENVDRDDFSGVFNEKCRECFEFLEKIEHEKFGCGPNTKRILHIWLASKLYEKFGMIKAMDQMREFSNFDFMRNDTNLDKKIKKMIKKMLIKKKIIPADTNLSQFLDSCEANLLTYDHYIKFEAD